jgi:hypothetical protein
MTKSILYLVSTLDKRINLPTTEEYYRALPFGHAAVLYRLEELGWGSRRLGFRDIWTPLAVARQMAKYRPAIVLTNSVIGLHPVIARRCFSRWRGPIVHTWDDFYEDIWRLTWGRTAGLFMRWFEKQIILRSDYIVTISRRKQAQAECWGKRAWYIPNGCDVPSFDPTKCPIHLDGKLKLVYCGDQGAYKRTEDIVSAMQRLPPEIKLYLIGHPNAELQRTAPPNVVFLGRLSENDKWSIMSQANVLVCTADTDCNAKFHEYLRMGKPILGHDGAANCLFQNGRNALLTRDYASAIMTLHRSPELRRTLAENAARDIPVYTWREIAAQYDRAFAEIEMLYWGVLDGRQESHGRNSVPRRGKNG